jgi:uncharacterized protein YndB with AHSA1/START domain
MNKEVIAKTAIVIAAPLTNVWEALIKPDLIETSGTQVITDWQVGSSILYTGTREGRKYQDKGRVLHIEKDKLLICTLWSSTDGLPDLPKNYKTVRYDLSQEGNGTRLTIHFSREMEEE